MCGDRVMTTYNVSKVIKHQHPCQQVAQSFVHCVFFDANRLPVAQVGRIQNDIEYSAVDISMCFLLYSVR